MPALNFNSQVNIHNDKLTFPIRKYCVLTTLSQLTKALETRKRFMTATENCACIFFLNLYFKVYSLKFIFELKFLPFSFW